MDSDSIPSESLPYVPKNRDGLYHVSLPGLRKDPQWIHHMEGATQTAVRLMKSGPGNKETILHNKRNLSIVMRRLSKSIAPNEEKLLQAAQTKLEDFVSHPTLRDVADYIIADAHYNYHANDPEFKMVDLGAGNTAQVESNYGTPRELAPVFDTPFQGEYKVNPYQAYAERARICKDKYSDADGYMRAPLAKIILDPTNKYVTEQVANKEELRLTKTYDSSWWHTNEAYFDRIWNHIDNLYTDLSKLVRSDQHTDAIDQKSSLISQIGWWYFQAMPYTRGSGAIGNVLLQTLFDYSDIKDSPYKVGVSPDLEALVTPLPMYVENFSKFFTRKFE